MLRPIAMLFVTLLPLPALALCNAPAFSEYLAPQDVADLEYAAADTLYGTGLYWSASKNGKRLSILGTMHLPDPRHTDLLDRVRPRMEAADLLMVEATKDDQTAMQSHMARNPDIMAITSGLTLPDRLDPATWDAVKDAAIARGVPGFMAAKMQPWFLTMTLSIPPCAMTAMMNGDLGLDAMLMDVAADANIPTAPLEAWQDTFALLTTGTFEDQLEMLQVSLMAPDLQDAMITELVDRYFDEQPAFGWLLGFYSVDFLPNITIADFDAQMVEFEETFLTARNRAWIPVIEGAAATHTDIFIGFGAAHLIGKHGVLNLLAQNGWDIAPL